MYFVKITLFVIINLIVFYRCVVANTIPVISYQTNGSFSDETYLKRSGKLGEGNAEIKELTVCVRIKFFYLRGRQTTFLSYGNIDSADALTGYIADLSMLEQFDLPYT